MSRLAASFVAVLFASSPLLAQDEAILEQLQLSPYGGARDVPLNARLFLSESIEGLQVVVGRTPDALEQIDLSSGSIEDGFELPPLLPHRDYLLHYRIGDGASFGSQFTASDLVDTGAPVLEPDRIVEVYRGQCNPGPCPFGTRSYQAAISFVRPEDESGIAFYSVYAKQDDGSLALKTRQFDGPSSDGAARVVTVYASFFEGESDPLVVTATDFAGNESEPVRDIEVSSSDARACACARAAPSSGGSGLIAALFVWGALVSRGVGRRRGRRFLR